MCSLELVHDHYKSLTKKLISRKLTITTMESCTSGFIASLITDTEGSSAVIKGACVTYCNEAKILNGVEAEIIKNYGVYSLETAGAMAEAVLKIYPSDIGIGVTGTFVNVDPNNEDSQPGEVYFAAKINGKLFANKIILPKNITRFESKIFVAEKVFELLESII